MIMQTQHRVLAGENVPAGEKLVSIFEPETAIIRKGKIGHAVEFGHVVWLGKVEGGVVSQYQISRAIPSMRGQAGSTATGLPTLTSPICLRRTTLTPV